MCMVTYNPFKRMAKKDITCYKIVNIFSRPKKPQSLDGFSNEGGFKAGELSVISSGWVQPYGDSTYEKVEEARKNGVEHHVLYRSPYNIFIFPEFGEDADHVGIRAEPVGTVLSLIKREVTRGYHSFVNKEDAKEYLAYMIGMRRRISNSWGYPNMLNKRCYDIIECVIPRGKIYMKGIFDQTDYKNYVSSSFRPVRSLGLAGELY